MRKLVRVIHASTRYLVCVSLLVGTAHAASNHLSLKNKFQSEAVRICATGHASSHYYHASDACWIAFDAFLYKGEFDRAVNVARGACKKYSHSDHCLLMAELSAEQGRFVQARYTPHSRVMLEAVQSALARISPEDIDDADVGMHKRVLARSLAQRAAQVRRVSQRPSAPAEETRTPEDIEIRKAYVGAMAAMLHVPKVRYESDEFE